MVGDTMYTPPHDRSSLRLRQGSLVRGMKRVVQTLMSGMFKVQGCHISCGALLSLLYDLDVLVCVRAWAALRSLTRA